MLAPRHRLVLAALVGAAAVVALPDARAQTGQTAPSSQPSITMPVEPPPDVSTPHISPELAAVQVDGDAADEAQAAYNHTAEELAGATSTQTGAAEQLQALGAQDVVLTARIAEATAARKAAALRLMAARQRVQAAAVSSYVAEAGADELTRVVDADESVDIGRVQTYADTVRADHELDADDAQAAVDEASRIVLDAQRERQDGRNQVATVTAARDQAAAEVTRLTADLSALADDEARVRASSRVHGADFTLTALDAYWKAALSQAECGVQWWAIAGISRVEGRHGQYGGSRVAADGQVSPPILGIPLTGDNGTRLIADTDGGALDGDIVYDRAVGPMQFIPSTWARWATDGDGDGDADPQNLYDATASAARYLCRGRGLSTEEGLRQGYFSYNHSQSYVETVLAHAYAYRELTIPVVPQS